jgi:hypothetical protein
MRSVFCLRWKISKSATTTAENTEETDKFVYFYRYELNQDEKRLELIEKKKN